MSVPPPADGEGRVAALLRRAERAERLAASLSLIGAAADTEQAVRHLVTSAMELLDGDEAVAILVYGESRERELTVRINRAGDSVVERDPGPQPAGTFAADILDGAPAIIVDDFAALDPQQFPLRETLMRRGMRAAAIVPIVDGQRRIGSLHVNHHQAGFFPPQALAVAEALAAQAGAVIERKRADLARQRAEAQYHALFEHAAEGIYRTTPAGTFLVANPALARMLGYDTPDQLLSGVRDIASEVYANPERRADYLQAMAEHGVVTGREERLRRRNGTLIWVSESARAVRDASGPIVSYEGTIQDVSERNEAEQRTRDLTRMKDEFVSLVSHELRTPLTSIKGYVDLVLGEEAGPLSSDQREFLGIVAKNVDRLVALISDLLDISRIEAGKLELRRTPLSLPSLMRDVEDTLRRQIKAKGQTLTVEVNADLPSITGDADWLTQVFVNLLSNAHKYTPAGGSIWLTVRAVRHAAGVAAVEVAVRDNGAGMTPEEQSRLFEKYYRASNRATGAVGGTGLGLAITRELVQLHGGLIDVRSALGQGSTFAVRLPVAPETTLAPEGRQRRDKSASSIVVRRPLILV